MHKLVEHVKKSIILTELGISKLDREIYYVDGMSSPKVRRLLNCLCESPNTFYLEVGSWKGSTLISALYGNNFHVDKAIAIDNFSEFEKPLLTNSINFLESITHNPDVPLSDRPVEEQFRANVSKYLNSWQWPKTKLEVINDDCFNPLLIKRLEQEYGGKVNMYFYDGNHSEESQYLGITLYDKLFADEFILMVDDWNDGNAEKGTRRAIKDMGYEILSEDILPARFNGDVYYYWQGQGLFVLRKPTKRWFTT